jgi:hypothetical protein
MELAACVLASPTESLAALECIATQECILGACLTQCTICEKALLTVLCLASFVGSIWLVTV